MGRFCSSSTGRDSDRRSRTIALTRPTPSRASLTRRWSVASVNRELAHLQPQLLALLGENVVDDRLADELVRIAISEQRARSGVDVDIATTAMRECRDRCAFDQRPEVELRSPQSFVGANRIREVD